MSELPIALAIQPILRQTTDAQRRQRLARLVRWTDGLIGELEQLNVAGVRTLPAAWRARLQLLMASLPFPCATDSLAPSMSPTEALDVVFDIQERIIELMGGVHKCSAVGTRAQSCAGSIGTEAARDD
jgi:hypothetical protein